MSKRFPALPNIAFLIDGNGEITMGSIASIPYAATASDDHQSFAMVVCRDDESLEQLLIRLNCAFEMAVEHEIFIDEINYGADDRLLHPDLAVRQLCRSLSAYELSTQIELCKSRFQYH